MNENKKVEEIQIEELNKENYLTLLLIGSAFLNIIGNENYKKFFDIKNREYINISRKLFLIGLVISLFVYLLFTKRDYENIILLKLNGKETFPSVVRFFGSLFIVLGILCFIYYQSNERNPAGGPGI